MNPSATKTAAKFDVDHVRANFPILGQQPYGHPLVYLDNAATGQRPQPVINAIRHFYEAENANVHRGVHYLSQMASERYETARSIVRRFLNASDPREIVFTYGTTDGLNLVASSYGQLLREGDEIVLTQMEHHSNIVPWQLLRDRKGVKIKVIPVTDDGELDLGAFRNLITDRTKVVSVVYVSNSLGTINPIREIARIAHDAGAILVVDGAQAAPHFRIDVQDLGCDFFAYSGHKAFSGTGIGALYGRYDLLEKIPPYRGGGNMIRSVTFEKTTYADPPDKFEAGTTNIAGAIGLGAAAEYLQRLDLAAAAEYEHDLIEYGMQVLESVPGVRLIGRPRQRAAVLSFVMDAAHPHDIGQILDGEGIAIRAGHHCTQPLMQRFGIPATARASLAFYNTREEIDRLGAALHKVNEVFG
jgi:cysteine desulfurase/selenocysteine lyase